MQLTPEDKAELQRLFSNAYSGLNSQNWTRSVNETDLCMYNNSNGYKCAIGFSIEPLEYDSSMELIALGSGLEEVILIALGVENASNDLHKAIVELQRLHDTSNSPIGMKQMFENFASWYQIEIPDSNYRITYH
ncbi:hypothetical protein [Chamaesiphon sp.]|uniref:hypothetical protein n=1 Tax=Chamaesiphon sp. TaxID=2814140 RepID=UPI0035936475